MDNVDVTSPSGHEDRDAGRKNSAHSVHGLVQGLDSRKAVLGEVGEIDRDSIAIAISRLNDWRHLDRAE
ncbi:hypothetical protein JCM31598_17480 [Desulfonatronum parangueonense]